MPPRKKEEQEPAVRTSRPATTPEAREQQLVSLAVDLAEKQLRDGTASPSVIGHFLKLAGQRERLEREILEKNAKLMDAKARNMDKERESEETAKAAIEAMKKYSPGS
jgi:hypothetical protein